MKEYVKKLASLGYSILPLNEDKSPIGGWKEWQTAARKPEQLDNYNPKLWGIACGHMNLEVVDVDLKVLPTTEMKKSFWEEYTDWLKSEIMDFEEKFVIVKTMNEGYHILYRYHSPEGNIKLAGINKSPQNRKGDTLIETRGKGGQAVIYNNFVSDLKYQDIKEINDSDRNKIFEISRFYDEITEEVEVEKELEKKEKKNRFDDPNRITVWDDFNSKNTILDVVGSSFKEVGRWKNKIKILRQNPSNPPTSSHSGYIFTDNGCMWLHSHNCSPFEPEKLYSPFTAYAELHHKGDAVEAAKELYKKGYGDRFKVKPPVKDESLKVDNSCIDFPLDIFPKPYQNYILENARTLNNSVDFMGCTLLFIISLCVGNSIKVEVKRGWVEVGNLWTVLVGKAGIGKTPSIKAMTFPINKLNNKEIRQYAKELQKWEEYDALDKKEKEMREEVKKPTKKQFIVNDITIEALVELHEENKNSIGVVKDELAGWLKDMNKYRAGSDLEFWLSSWSGESVSLNRKVARSNFLAQTFIPVMGGIQPSILDAFYTEENKDNGFLDRMLFCYPDLEIEKYNSKEMDQNILEWYESEISSMFSKIRNNLKFDQNNEIEPHYAKFTKDADIEWQRIFNKITDSQNSDSENEYMKSMLPKQKSYIPRFALLLNVLHAYSSNDIRPHVIEKESVLRAEKLSNYFIEMAKKIKASSNESRDLRTVIKGLDGKDAFEKFKAIHKVSPESSTKKLAEMLGVSERTIRRYKEKI